MKEPKCSYCGGAHYKINCFQAPRKPIKISSTPLKRTPIKRSATKTAVYPSKPKPRRTTPVSQRKQYIKELDSIFSKYIRLKESKDGVCTCITCGKRDSWKNMHACHYIGRRYIGTRFDERNVHAGCHECNVIKNGNLEAYKIRLMRKYGRSIISELDNQKTNRIPTYQLEDMLKYYTQCYKAILL